MISYKSPIQSSLFASRSLDLQQSEMAQAVERLSSGIKIRRASDSVSGLGISQHLQKQASGLQVSSRNALDAVSMAQTAEGALRQVSDMLIRMKELTAQGATDGLTLDQKRGITQEISQLRDEINAVASRTTYNNVKLLIGAYSEAIAGKFSQTIAPVQSSDKAIFADTSFRVGDSSATNATPAWSSIIEISDFKAQPWASGEYALSADRSSLTLTRTINGNTQSQTLTLVEDGTSTWNGEVNLSNSNNGITTLNFSQLGIALDIKNTRVGNNHNTAEVAALIAGIGVKADLTIANQWTAVTGAAWNHGRTGTIKAIVTATDGTLRLGQTTGLTTVTGYNDPRTLPPEGATQIAFIGSQADVNAALESLQMNAANGKGRVDIQVMPSQISVDTRNGITSYYEEVTSGSNVNWSAARSAALSKTFDGNTGYLTNVTSSTEQTFLDAKGIGPGWIGGSDTAVDGQWRWMDGPEAGTQFWQGQAAGAAVGGAYNNWAAGEPNETRINDWITIEGAVWDYGLTGNIKAIVTSSGGSIKLGTNTGLSAVIGYGSSWASGTATSFALSGNKSDVDAALATLQMTSSTGTGNVTVEIVAGDYSVNTTSDGITSYYRVLGPTDWNSARSLAKQQTLTVGGVTYTGYLANITSSEENIFLKQKLPGDAWIGASDAAVEGVWKWVDGPEAGERLTDTYQNWNSGEPNDSSGEDYAEFYYSNNPALADRNGKWNDLSGTSSLSYIVEFNDGEVRENPLKRTFDLQEQSNDDFARLLANGTWSDDNNANTAYIVEYQGVAQKVDSTNKTFWVGQQTKISVGFGIEITNVESERAAAGVYRLSANSEDYTATLSHYDTDGATLLGAQTIATDTQYLVGAAKRLNFDALDVAITLKNVSAETIELDSNEGGLANELTVASSVMREIIGRDGVLFQTGENSRHNTHLNVFRDLRLGENEDDQYADMFNTFDSKVSALASVSIEQSVSAFQDLSVRTDDLITIVSQRRSELGAIQIRLEYGIDNLSAQSAGIQKTYGQIMDTDYAWETARLMRVKVGQEAASAMLAQANLLPNLISALIE